MTKHRNLIIPAVLTGLVLLALGVIYLVDSANALPTFLPGHQTGSPHHHVKHAIAALLLSAACFVLAWFQTAPATAASPR
jgi:amino acid permease